MLGCVFRHPPYFLLMHRSIRCRHPKLPSPIRGGQLFLGDSSRTDSTPASIARTLLDHPQKPVGGGSKIAGTALLGPMIWPSRAGEPKRWEQRRKGKRHFAASRDRSARLSCASAHRRAFRSLPSRLLACPPFADQSVGVVSVVFSHIHDVPVESPRHP